MRLQSTIRNVDGKFCSTGPIFHLIIIVKKANASEEVETGETKIQQEQIEPTALALDMETQPQYNFAHICLKIPIGARIEIARCLLFVFGIPEQFLLII